MSQKNSSGMKKEIVTQIIYMSFYLKKKKSKEANIYIYITVLQNSILYIFASSGKELTCQCRRHKRWVRSLGQEDPLKEEMATHCSILAWSMPRTEEPGRLQAGTLLND